MYEQELDREARLQTQGWAAILRDLSGFFRTRRLMLALPGSRTLSTFDVHRVPGSDYLK